MKRTLVILAGSTLAVSIAVAQGKPAEKPGATPAAPAAKATPAAPAAPAAKAAPAAATAAAKAAAPAAAPAAAAPAAATAAPPGAPKPPPELDATFKVLEGNWKCDTKIPAGSMGPGSPEMSAKSTVKFKKSLDGFFYQGEYEVKKGKNNPAMKATLYFGYQPVAKVYTNTAFDNMGSTASTVSTGFQGDSITFTGEGYMMGQKAKVRDSMTKKGPKAVSHKFEVDMGKGFASMGEDECTR